MRIAIVGGNGFLGSHLIDRLREIGPSKLESVLIVSRSGTSPPCSPLDPRFAAIKWNARTDPHCSWINKVDILINLVGIKRPTSDNDFEFAHVEIPKLLVRAAEGQKVQRIIHISIAGCRTRANRPYLDSKWTGEKVVRESKVPCVILRPGIIYGKGDDLLFNLIRLIRHSPYQVAPKNKSRNLQLVNVKDVAEAIISSIDSKTAILSPFNDLVHHEQLKFEDLVYRVSEAMGLRSIVLRFPQFLLVAAAALFEAISKNPLLTRAQFFLLSEGVEGDSSQAQSSLDWTARPFSSEVIRRIIDDDPRLSKPFLGFSLRLQPLDDFKSGSPTLEPLRFRSSWPIVFAIGIICAVMLVIPMFIASIWHRVIIFNLLQMGIISYACNKTHWQLLRPNFSFVGWGILSAGLLWICGYFALFFGEEFFPQIHPQLIELHSWTSSIPTWLSLVLVVWTVTMEEIFWRGLVNFEAFQRWGGIAVLLSSTLYTVAHLTSGPPLLIVAAFLLGLIWSLMAIRFRNLFLPWICHLGWDLLALYVFPYSNLLHH